MNDAPRIWLTEWEAAEYVGRSRLTIRDWRVRGHVQARKRKQTWEFDRDSLRNCRDRMAWKQSDRLVVHYGREEAFEYLNECLRQKVRFPNDPGLARMMNVSYPQARAWRNQWLKTLKADTWDHSDEEIARRVNGSVFAIAEARAAYQAKLRSKFRK